MRIERKSSNTRRLLSRHGMVILITKARFGRYINLGHGDESLKTICGDRFARLKAIKQRFDPELKKKKPVIPLVLVFQR